jgi:hypothetical protein
LSLTNLLPKHSTVALAHTPSRPWPQQDLPHGLKPSLRMQRLLGPQLQMTCMIPLRLKLQKQRGNRTTSLQEKIKHISQSPRRLMKSRTEISRRKRPEEALPPHRVDR